MKRLKNSRVKHKFFNFFQKILASKSGSLRDIEKQSNNLNVKFDDLLKVFTDPAFLEKETKAIVVKSTEKK